MTLHDEVNPIGAGACGCDSCERERELEADIKDYEKMLGMSNKRIIGLESELEYARTMLLPELRQTFYDDVRAFHASWHPIQASPRLLTGDEWARRVRLITEELAELAKAHAFRDLVGFADGVVDLAWVVFGTGVEAGLPFNSLWHEVRRANMDKFRDGVKLDLTGKILKPPGWNPPDIKGVLGVKE